MPLANAIGCVSGFFEVLRHDRFVEREALRGTFQISRAYHERSSLTQGSSDGITKCCIPILKGYFPVMQLLLEGVQSGGV